MPASLDGVTGLFLDRVALAYHSRTNLSFPVSETYARYSQYALGEVARARVRQAQSQTAEGEGILVYMSLPFHLDFTRNRIASGSKNDWLDFPVGAAPGAARDFLRDRDIRYVMWEYRGYGMKSDRKLRSYLKLNIRGQRTAEYHLYMRDLFRRLRKESDVVHDDGGMAVIDLGESEATGS